MGGEGLRSLLRWWRPGHAGKRQLADDIVLVPDELHLCARVKIAVIGSSSGWKHKELDIDPPACKTGISISYGVKHAILAPLTW